MISQVGILEWVAISSREASQPMSPAMQANSLSLSHRGSPIQIYIIVIYDIHFLKKKDF